MTKIGMVAVHYPKTEHRQEFVARVRRAAEVVGAAEGCLAADCWTTSDGAVVSTAQWRTESAMRASFDAATAAGVDFAFDGREARPRDIMLLAAAG
jgi:quinol monooxygenase YgiN